MKQACKTSVKGDPAGAKTQRVDRPRKASSRSEINGNGKHQKNCRQLSIIIE
ncbi:hypothetical protein KEH51_22505 [[Brevibacterium] frigoritolerans]|uniref:Uncharacterized protein n=1 Tax=Peribacillus frigoritolerans TaxID=450367 RepID=A0A941FKC3_9BACI|nr:hypothetical protein [Peribacillus frigoritolerans]